jgi:SAM-dependent methyltransferase
MNHSDEELETAHPFDRAGLASLDDLHTQEWRELFGELEAQQGSFLAEESRFRSKGYRWVSDSLHTCIRVWEYPFVYHHLRTWGGRAARGAPARVVDLGSGVTFFPFAVANLGYEVVAVDMDPIGAVDYRRAVALLPLRRGSLCFECADAAATSLPTGCADCVYCVSVLEHVADAPSVVDEVARVLRPGGLFLLTFDVDLLGTSSIGPRLYRAVRAALSRSFDLVFPEITVHPMRVLTSDNSPYPYYGKRGARRRRYWFITSRAAVIRGLLRGQGLRRAPKPILASTYGACLRKRAARAPS